MDLNNRKMTKHPPSPVITERDENDSGYDNTQIKLWLNRTVDWAPLPPWLQAQRGGCQL